MRTRLFFLATLLLTTGILARPTQAFDLADADTHDRLTYHRAIEAAVWAMPLMNYKFYRDALIDAGVGPYAIGYYSQLQDWRFRDRHAEQHHAYILAHWTLADGPVVVEMLPAQDGVGIFGYADGRPQRPIDDVGAAGRDKGRGATYLLVPPSYDGPLLPGALVYEQPTHDGWVVLRPIIPSASAENLAKAEAVVRQIRIYRWRPPMHRRR